MYALTLPRKVAGPFFRDSLVTALIKLGTRSFGLPLGDVQTYPLHVVKTGRVGRFAVDVGSGRPYGEE